MRSPATLSVDQTAMLRALPAYRWFLWSYRLSFPPLAYLAFSTAGRLGWFFALGIPLALPVNVAYWLMVKQMAKAAGLSVFNRALHQAVMWKATREVFFGARDGWPHV